MRERGSARQEHASAAAKAGRQFLLQPAKLSRVTLFTVHMLAPVPHAGPYVEVTIEGATRCWMKMSGNGFTSRGE